MTQPQRGNRFPRLVFLAGVVAAALAVKRAGWTPVRVEGDSMEPTLPAGSLVAVSPVDGDPPYGAVVVVRRPDGSEHIKRIVATPGDRWRSGSTVGELRPGQFAIAGDNRRGSIDSRRYGPVSRDEIVAVARLCYWPVEAWGLLTVRG